jgi:hypothetical protein
MYGDLGADETILRGMLGGRRILGRRELPGQYGTDETVLEH